MDIGPSSFGLGKGHSIDTVDHDLLIHDVSAGNAPPTIEGVFIGLVEIHKLLIEHQTIATWTFHCKHPLFDGNETRLYRVIKAKGVPKIKV